MTRMTEEEYDAYLARNKAPQEGQTGEARGATPAGSPVGLQDGTVIGIDPGITGAIARVIYVDGVSMAATVMDLPTFKHGYDTLIETGKLCEVLHVLAVGMADVVVVERQIYVPGHTTGLETTWVNYGRLTACLGDWVDVQPKTWKRAFDLTANKYYSRMVAQAMFPMMKDELQRKRDHGRAEALLLAEYGRQYLWTGA